MSEGDFQERKYQLLTSVLDLGRCSQLTTAFNQYIEQGNSIKDSQCTSSDSVYGFPEFEKLLVELCPVFEKASGKRLIPTYSYARRYVKGEILENHVDRPACEISATVTLGYGGGSWPIYMGNADKSVANEIVMDIGDAVVYKGEQIHHWREEFTGEWQVQVFLHYVDADGQNVEWAYDKREKLNIEESKNDAEMLYCFYDDILNSKACDIIIKTYTQDGVLKEDAIIGFNTIDKSVRNVERVQLPTYKDIGGRLAAVGFSANFHRWKFDVTNASQAEFLSYPTGGKYTTHVDTFISPGSDCRKLTVLAFLNDDFEGGRFYLQTGSNKFYPPQTPGTVLVFPSFIAHGVEEITSGVRYSVVCWMNGPWFK